MEQQSAHKLIVSRNEKEIVVSVSIVIGFVLFRGKKWKKGHEMAMIRINWLVLLTILLLFCSQDVTGRRGRGRARTKSRVKISFSFADFLIFLCV